MKIFSNIALDLGTSKILAYSRDGSLIMDEATFIALDEDGNVIEVGNNAKRMFGRVQNDVKVFNPMKRGTITDENPAFLMLKILLKRYKVRGLLGTRVVATMGVDLSEGEEETFIDLLDRLRFSRIHVIPSIVAIALYAGANIMSEEGLMVVDMGAGKTDVGVISIGEVVLSKRFEVGGGDIDEVIIDHVRETFSILISLESAEKLKMKIGKEDVERIVGVDTKTGLPKEIEIPLESLMDPVDQIVDDLIDGIREVMENMKPELVEGVYRNGVILGGGLSLLHGMERKMMDRMKMMVRRVDDPIHSSTLGAVKVFSNREFLKLTEVI